MLHRDLDCASSKATLRKVGETHDCTAPGTPFTEGGS
jgi:hypothetical protein